MSTHNEIERKFLVTTLPDGFFQRPHVEIVQGYLALDPHGAEVRLRQFGAQRLITVKNYRANARIEREIALTDAQFAELWPATEGRRLRKVRYQVPYQQYMIEVDVYQGDAAGLIVADIEFPDQKSRVDFQKADWLGTEISGLQEYSNHALATE
jgi:adenylate cyclase